MSKNERGSRRMSREDVKRSAEENGADLLIIGNKVYDLTTWKARHPGGHLPIQVLRGRDATDPVQTTHPKRVLDKYLHLFEYADLVDPRELSPVEKDFRALTVRMEGEGLFETRYSFYVIYLSILFSLLACVWLGVLLSTSAWAHFACAVGLGVFWQQLAFVGHDAGHNSITKTLNGDSVLGVVIGNAFTGISIGWWKRSHNVHHIVCNSIENDPDIQHLPVFAVAPEFLHEKVLSTFYNRVLPNTGLAHVLCRYQHLLYYPVMAFARYNLYAQSLLHTLGVGPYKRSEVLWCRHLQLAALVFFYSWLSLLVAQLPTAGSKAMFVGVSHAVAGILHVQITLSHFGMATYKGVTYSAEDNGFVQTQLRTTLNISCPPYMDWFHGGLHFQVEHHLWPRVPRHNLRAVQKHLLTLCAKHHLEYHTAPFVAANKIMLSKLHETAQTTKHLSDIMHDSFFAVG